MFVTKAGITHVHRANGRVVPLICALSRFRVHLDLAVAPVKALMIDLPHASIHRD